MNASRIRERAEGGHRSRSEPRRRWARFVVVAGLLVTGVVAGACSDDEGQPTLRFDGTSATYTGPSTLEAGEVTFVVENDSDLEIGFVWGRHSEDGHDLDEAMAWADENPGALPPWVEEAVDIGDPLPAGMTTEQTTTLEPGPHDLLAFDAAAYVGWIATVIQVTDEQ